MENDPKKLKPLGIYLHIPFCVRKCNYCDFVSFPGQGEDTIEAYVRRLCEDIAIAGQRMGAEYVVDTVFVGGGTPSLLSPGQLVRMLNTIQKHFSCAWQEVTLESNPGTFDRQKLQDFRAAGMDRLSMGAQSLDDGVLKRLGRIHDSEAALSAMRAAASLDLNFNVDLMLGIPDQSLAIWEDTLRRTIAEGPSHISFYSLQLEMGTPFYRDFKNGLLELPEWEENRAMYHSAVDILKDAGYGHYEISNAALPGRECRHNLKYWTMQDYLGIGMAAHSFLDGKRCFTGSDLGAYLEGSQEPEWEEGDEEDRKTDFVFTELRLIRGFSKDDYKAMFGSAFEQDFGPAYRNLLQQGLLEEADGFVKLTPAGLDRTNPVMEELLNG